MPSKVAIEGFSTSELTEAIFIHLDTKDVVAGLKTCRILNLTIRGSKKLDQKRFLEPVPVHSFLEWGTHTSASLQYGTAPTFRTVRHHHHFESYLRERRNEKPSGPTRH